MDNAPTSTDRYAVVGYPVDHSRSPLIHGLFARQTGERLTYGLLPARAQHFETAVKDFAAAGGRGLNVTLPHKEAAFELAHEVGPEARRARAVNTLSLHSTTRIRGDNTDGIGFVRDLTENHHVRLRGKRVLVLGAGGAARGILPPLLDAELAELVLANRTVERANGLVKLFDAADRLVVCSFDALAGRAAFDIVINATSAGVRGESPPFPASSLGADCLCYDLSYSVKQTPFVQWAEDHGAARAVQGWGMLIEQAAESFAIWRGIRPDTAPVLQQLAHRRPARHHAGRGARG